MKRALILAAVVAALMSATPASAQSDPQNTLKLDTTKGMVTIQLRPDLAPKHVERIKLLAREKFYDNAPFHRVIPGFMAQTGDGAKGDGTGGSKHPNLQAEFSAQVNQSWIGLDAALIHDETNEVYAFGEECSYYNDDGEVEDHRDQVAYLSSLPAGHYILRAELTWPKGTPRPPVRLTLTSGVARTMHFMLALLALFAVPAGAWILSASFEKARWEEGTETP